MIDIGRKIDLKVSPTSPSQVEGAFDQDDCRRLLEFVEKQKLADYYHEPHARFSATQVPYVDESAWVYGKLYDLALELNQALYQFEPLDMVEEIWYQVYREGDYANWKTELNAGYFANRKLALFVNLSSSDDYRGGQFIINDGSLLTASRGLGDATALPGYLLNQTEPITSGEKKVIVAWFGGTHLK